MSSAEAECYGKNSEMITQAKKIHCRTEVTNEGHFASTFYLHRVCVYTPAHAFRHPHTLLGVSRS